MTALSETPLIESRSYDVVVVGAGCGGICAAIQAARAGASTLLIEKAPEIGGTGVHSPVGLVCKFRRRDTGEAVNVGLHKELFPEAYAWNGEFGQDDLLPTYNHHQLAERYQRLTANEPNLTVLTGTAVSSITQAIERKPRKRIQSIGLDTGKVIRASVYIDGTADGNLAALAGADFQKGRPGDGKMQSATLTFGLSGFDRSQLGNPEINTWGGYWSLNDELTALYQHAKANGRTRNPKSQIYAFAYPDGDTLLFNCNEIGGVDPTVEGSREAGRKIAQGYVKDLIGIVQEHPAFRDSRVAFVSPWLGVREGRRIIGEHILTGAECLGEARFDDAIAAGAYDIDVHDEAGDHELQRIPNTQYYHIPYRSLRARGHTNLLLGSRCISGDFEAHSSYRVMSSLTGIGQAAGAAAALGSKHTAGDVHAVSADWIRHDLKAAGQWIEGSITPPPVQEAS